MNRILCSTGALIGRPNGRDFTLLKDFLPHLECDGLEFMMYDTWYDKIEQITDFMLNLPTPCHVFHIEKSVGDLISRNVGNDTEKAIDLFEVNCQLAKTLGSETLVLHLWGGLDSDKNIRHNIKYYSVLRSIADKYNIRLTVENVVCNHADPMTHMAALAKAYPDIQFTFDTKMAAFHNQIDALYEPSNQWIANHIFHFHINDYGGGYKEWSKLNTLHIGNGHIDFDKLFDFTDKIGYSGDYTVEATSFDEYGIINFDALNSDFGRIRDHRK